MKYSEHGGKQGTEPATATTRIFRGALSKFSSTIGNVFSRGSVACIFQSRYIAIPVPSELSMSIYYADPSEATLSNRTHGFYDGRSQIVIIPSYNYPPHVVIDHEVTHINLCSLSVLGLIEQAVTFLGDVLNSQIKFLRIEPDDKMLVSISLLVSDLALMRALLQQHSEVVHEGVAWFSTEMQTRDIENIRAPSRYDSATDMLRRLFSSTIPDIVDRVEIAQAIGIYALSPPLLAPRRYSGGGYLKFLREGLAENPPLSRFQEICNWLKPFEQSEMISWAKWVYRNVSMPCNEAKWVPRKRSWFSLREEVIEADWRYEVTESSFIASFAQELLLDTVRISEGVWGVDAARVLLDSSPAILAQWDDLELRWMEFKTLTLFSRGVDRYAQTVIIEPQHTSFTETSTDKSPPAELYKSKFIMISSRLGDWGHITGEDTLGDAPLEEKAFVAGLVGNKAIRWITDWEVLETVVATGKTSFPIIVSSEAYQFHSFCYPQADWLAQTPHVVMAILDFRTLWMKMSWRNFLAPKETVFPRKWESQIIFSERLKEYGYLLLKPNDRLFPIVMNPIVATQWKRIRDTIPEISALPGIELTEAGSDRDKWMGDLRSTIEGAIDAFEFPVSAKRQTE